MDTYGIINLTELDRLIFEMKRKINETFDPIEVKTFRGALIAYAGIKIYCEKLPSAKDVFWANEVECQHYDDHEWKYKSFEDYITQFIKSDKP